MKEIKFRAWDKVAEDMVWFNLSSIARGLYLFEPTNDRAFELMQYTGLKDKNGKEIYEDDIVRTEKISEFPHTVFMVVWDDNDACFEAKHDEWIGFLGTSCEVIGNIYENPELLEKGGC